jgi:hypothetical protein
MDVSYNKTEIIAAVATILQNGKAPVSSVYGGGKSGNAIAHLLATLPLQFHKTISY